MAEILLVNPSRRPSKRKSNPSPAQKRARAKFAAMARAKSKGASMSTAKRRRRNPAKRKVRAKIRHRNPTPIVRSRARRHARRRNPIGMNSTGKPLSLLTPAFVGALGATAVNTLYSNIATALPVAMTTGNMVYATRAGLSLALAMLAPHAGSKKAAVLQMAEGSLTVVMHDAIVNLSGGMGMALNGMGVYMPGRVQRPPSASGRPGVQMNGMGAYLTGSGAPAPRQVLPVARKSGMRF